MNQNTLENEGKEKSLERERKNDGNNSSDDGIKNNFYIQNKKEGYWKIFIEKKGSSPGISFFVFFPFVTRVLGEREEKDG